MAHLTCWIGLDDATRDNGCLAYIPKSHEWELLPITGLGMLVVESLLAKRMRASRGGDHEA